MEKTNLNTNTDTKLKNEKAWKKVQIDKDLKNTSAAELEARACPISNNKTEEEIEKKTGTWWKKRLS